MTKKRKEKVNKTGAYARSRFYILSINESQANRALLAYRIQCAACDGRVTHSAAVL